MSVLADVTTAVNAEYLTLGDLVTMSVMGTVAAVGLTLLVAVGWIAGVVEGDCPEFALPLIWCVPVIGWVVAGAWAVTEVIL